MNKQYFMIMNKIKIFTIMVLAGLSFGLVACSPKTNTENLTRLEARETILALNTELNDLKIKLEKETLSLSSLQNDVEQANESSSKSAADAKRVSNDLSKNPGDLKLSSQANNAAKEAARDAKRATKLNDSLGKSNNKIKKYQKDIESKQAKLKDLETKIEFSPNTINQ
jgi:chromosome segregation ATPase